MKGPFLWYINSVPWPNQFWTHPYLCKQELQLCSSRARFREKEFSPRSWQIPRVVASFLEAVKKKTRKNAPKTAGWTLALGMTSASLLLADFGPALPNRPLPGRAKPCCCEQTKENCDTIHTSERKEGQKHPINTKVSIFLCRWYPKCQQPRFISNDSTLVWVKQWHLQILNHHSVSSCFLYIGCFLLPPFLPKHIPPSRSRPRQDGAKLGLLLPDLVELNRPHLSHSSLIQTAAGLEKEKL